MPSTRTMNPAAFLRDTVAPSLVKRGPVDPRPVVCCDENMNQQALSALLAQLVADGVVQSAEPLWYQSRIAADGTRFAALGSTSASGVPGFGKTRHDPAGRSTPDEVIIAGAVGRFLHHDRVCLLTADGGRNRDGMRSILDGEIAPTLRGLNPQRLGLLVLFRSPQSTLAQYHQAAVARLRAHPPEPGYNWEEIGQPSDVASQ